jgi:hypothetical protein
MQTDPEEPIRVAQKRMLEQIVAIPATLYLPTRFAKPSGTLQNNLSLKLSEARSTIGTNSDEYVMTLPEEPEDLVWPKDPVFCLACVTTAHIINNFSRCSHDPVALAQLKADAPTEWSFSSLEESEEIDDADWWKTYS